jgi:uncharacterized protein (DUF1778 family)
MPHIQVELDPADDALLAAAAKQEGRSKREQMKRSALTHARSIVPDFHFQENQTAGEATQTGRRSK